MFGRQVPHNSLDWIIHYFIIIIIIIIIFILFYFFMNVSFII